MLEPDGTDVRSALEAFGPVWDCLWSTERSRILGLLVERIDHDGRDGKFEVRLRADGIRSISQTEPA